MRQIPAASYLGGGSILTDFGDYIGYAERKTFVNVENRKLLKGCLKAKTVPTIQVW